MKFTWTSVFQFVSASLLVATVFFFALKWLSEKNFLSFSNQTASEPLPDPLPYDTVGDYPSFEEGSSANPAVQEKKYTLELGLCNDKTCIERSLKSLSRNGVDAFYTPARANGKIVYHIRRGIFSSRKSAEKAQSMIHLEKKLEANVVEL